MRFQHMSQTKLPSKRMKGSVTTFPAPTLLPSGRMLLTVQETADRLGVHLATVYRMFESGDLPYVQVRPRIRRVDPLDLQQYIERMKMHTR
jgi:excisionase family DNA binding protein